LCSQFYKILALVKKYNRFKMVDRKNRTNFEKRIMNSTNSVTDPINASKKSEHFSLAPNLDGVTKTEIHSEAVKSISDPSDPSLVLTKQKLIQRYSSKSNKLKEINSKLIEISETMSTFASHVFQQEQATNESSLISTKSGRRDRN
jgi:hypothetical protein